MKKQSLLFVALLAATLASPLTAQVDSVEIGDTLRFYPHPLLGQPVDFIAGNWQIMKTDTILGPGHAPSIEQGFTNLVAMRGDLHLEIRPEAFFSWLGCSPKWLIGRGGIATLADGIGEPAKVPAHPWEHGYWLVKSSLGKNDDCIWQHEQGTLELRKKQ